MNDWRSRLHVEQADLFVKLEKLQAFIGTPAYSALAQVDQTLLVQQACHMRAYCDVLTTRLGRLCGSA